LWAMARRREAAAARHGVAVPRRGQGSAAPGKGVRGRRWLRRYLPAEAAGTSAALAAAVVAAHWSVEAAVVAAAWAETVAFYAFVTTRELRNREGSPRSPRRVAGAARDVVSEFGVAECVDTLFARPVLMYAFVAPLGSLVAGVAIGKLAADVVFYGLSIPAYELRERRRA
jgi:hypothetical protein